MLLNAKTLIITPQKTKEFEAALEEKKLKELKALSKKKPASSRYFAQEAGSSPSHSSSSLESNDSFENRIIQEANQEILGKFQEEESKMPTGIPVERKNDFRNKKSNIRVVFLDRNHNLLPTKLTTIREKEPLKQKYQAQKSPVASKKLETVKNKLPQAPRFQEVKAKAVPGVGSYKIPGSFGKKSFNKGKKIWR